MGKILDWLFGVLARPVGTFREIAVMKPVGWALVVYLGVLILSALVSFTSLQASGTLDQLGSMLAFSVSYIFIIVSSVILGLLSLFIATGLLHLFARLFGGSGSYGALLSVYCFAYFPMILTVPLNLVSGFLGLFGGILSSFAVMAVSIWVLVLEVIALRESHKLSTGISILVYLIQFLILVVIPLALVVGLVAYFIYTG